MRCIIVGTGPSARGFIAPEGETIIAVKGAIYLPGIRANYWFSLDSNNATREQMNTKVPGVQYFCACEDGTRLPEHVERLHRISAHWHRKAPTNIGSPEWWCWRWRAVLGLNETPGNINTGNSAWGALGLAYHLGYRDVLLVGVDGTGDERTNGGFPKNLSHLPLLFQSALPQVRLHTVGKMRGIPSTTLEQWCSQ